MHKLLKIFFSGEKIDSSRQGYHSAVANVTNKNIL